MRCDTSGLSRCSRLVISTHAPRVRCDDILRNAINEDIHISTHAPRVRCDGAPMPHYAAIGISTHAPRVRCDILCYNIYRN